MDGVFETAWPPSEYLLLPSNADPETAGNSLSRPYTAVEAAGKKRLPKGGKLEITGRWGWWSHLRRAPEGLSSAVDADAAAVALSGDSGVEAGQTLLVDSEQLYVRSRSGDSLGVDRGVNGTVPAAHEAGAPVWKYEYPAPVVTATLLQAVRLWRAPNRTAPGADNGLEPEARVLLSGYRRPALGV